MKETDNEERIMPEGYGSELEGCLWLVIIIAIAAVAGGIWLFSR